MRKINLTYKRLHARPCCLIALVLISFPQIARGEENLPMLKIAIEPVGSSGSAEDTIPLEDEDALTNLIQARIHKTAVIEEIAETAIDWKRASMLSDTEGSASSEERETYNDTKHQEKHEVDNYAKYSESISPATLARHAQQIHTALPQNEFAHHTTTFCVALKSSDDSIKKFVFCNRDLMPPDLRRKAEYELGYHVARAGQAHAEGEFLQFLWKRRKQTPPLYTHIVAMGCSRPHCAECDVLLQLVLGKGYTAISAAMDDNNKVVEGASAVASDRKYQNYYIPQGLQSLIETLTGVRLSCRGRYLSSKRSYREDRLRTEPDTTRLKSLRKTSVRERRIEEAEHSKREGETPDHREAKKPKTSD